MTSVNTQAKTLNYFMIMGLLLVLFSPLNSNHFEKFFEVDGGPEYMYYFAKLEVGSTNMEQSAIIDTGSDTLAFPCDYCEGKNCGTHQDPRFGSKKSLTFGFEVRCPTKILYHSQHVCQFVKSYAEGSSLLGFLGKDYMKFKDTKRITDLKLKKLNSMLKKDLKLKAEFGCTTKETGLFKTQYADGILGLDNGSTFIESIENENSFKEPHIFSFGLCFHNTGGIMSIDLRRRDRPDDKIVMLNKNINAYNNPIVVPYTTNNNYFEVLAVSFEVDNIHLSLPKINVMIDSGTTFTHFPTPYIKAILNAMNSFCSSHSDRCGKIPHAVFTEDSCLQYKQPDENYATVHDLLNSFPEIKINFIGASRPYIIYPKNYFYQEFDEKKSTKEARLCMSLKGEEEGRIILGAFSMIDNYFYFDRKSRQLKIFQEDCYLRSAQILKKERILEELNVAPTPERINWENVGILFLSMFGLTLGIFGFWKRKVGRRGLIPTSSNHFK